MPNKAGRSTEHDISMAVLRYLETIPHGEAAMASIKKHIPNFINLTDDDMDDSPTRAHEKVWEQQVRNIVSHRASHENFIHDGLLEYSPGNLKITDAGRLYLKQKGLI